MGYEPVTEGVNATKIQGRDVAIGSPLDGFDLKWDASLGKWVPQADPASSGGGEWGDITGTLSDQTDLQSALTTANQTANWGGISGTVSDQDDLQAALDLKLTTNTITTSVRDLFAAPPGTTRSLLSITDTGVVSYRTPSNVLSDIGAQAVDADLTTWSSITPGTGVGTALAVNVGSAGAFVTNGGALGTPSSGVATNLTSIPAGNLTGSIADARLSANVPLLNVANTFTGSNLMTLGGNLTVSGGTVNANTITATSATNLTLNAGSSGATVSLGQGTNGAATLSSVGTGITTLNLAGAAKAKFDPATGQANFGLGINGYYQIDCYGTAAASLASTSTRRSLTLQTGTGNTGLIGMSSGFKINWSSNVGGIADANANHDTGLARNAANIVEVNTGTAISGTSNAASIKALTFIPVGTATSCTGATIGTGSKSNAGFVTATTTGVSTIVVTFPVTAPTGWNINADNQTTANVIRQTAGSTTTATLSGTTVTGDVISYIAMPY